MSKLPSFPAVTLALVALALTANAAHAQPPAAKLTLQKGDRVVFVGNTFAERAREFGYIEALFQARWPDLGLTFRNLGYSADEVNLQPRPLNFGDMHQHLAEVKADVILLCYGMNESFKGAAGLDAFAKGRR